MANTEEKKEFLKGVLFSCQYLVIGHSEYALAEMIMRESGFTKNKFLLAQRPTQFHNKKMNKVIKEAFKKMVTQKTMQESNFKTKQDYINHKYNLNRVAKAIENKAEIEKLNLLAEKWTTWAIEGDKSKLDIKQGIINALEEYKNDNRR